MKKWITAILAVCLLLSLTACSSKGEPNPYSVNILYQASDSESCFIYSFTIGQYRDVGAPEFMGIPLWMDFDGHYLLVSSDGSMEYREKPFDSVNGTPLESNIPLEQQDELIQTVLQTDQALPEECELDADSILVHFAGSTENGITLVFADTLHPAYYVFIAEFDATGALMRLAQVNELRNSMIEDCSIFERN
jgi:hypothetical protein